MLHFVRRHARSKVVWVLVAAIIAVFVLWGVEAVVSGVGSFQAVATVDGEPIEQLEVQRAEMNLSQAYRQAYKDAFTPELQRSLNLRQQALDGLIDRALLAKEATRLGIEIPDQELRDEIVANPAFQVDGRFDKERYLRALRYSRLTPGDYEEGRRRDLAIERLQSLIQDGVTVSASELESLIFLEREKQTISFVRIASADLQSKVEVTPEALTAYFDQNRDKYKEPEKIRVTVLEYERGAFEKGVEVSEEEIQKFYEDNKESRFTQEQEIQAWHILIRSPSGKDEDLKKEARKRIEEVEARVKGGEDFAQVAMEVSEDTATKAKGGDLGYFSRGRMVPEFDEAAFALKKGEISGIVESPFGLHIIRVGDVREERVKSLEEVREEIVRTQRSEKAADLARRAAEEDRAALGTGKTFEEVAKAREMSASSPEPIAKNAPLPDLPASRPVTQALWALEAGGITEPTLAGQSWVVAKLEEKLPERQPTLDEVRARVETDFRREKATEVAKQTAQEILNKAKASSLEAAAQEAGKTVEKTEPFGRQGPLVPGVGVSQEVKDATYRLNEKSPLADQVFVVAGDAILLGFGERTKPSKEEISEQLTTMRDRVLEQRRQAVIGRFMKELKAQSEILVDRVKLEQLPVG